MLTFVQLQLGQGLDAEPNAPEPHVSVVGSTVQVRFRVQSLFQDARSKQSSFFGMASLFLSSVADQNERWGTLSFFECSRWRWDPTNDHEWYKGDGDGRYSRVAPQWGKFYELIGDDPLRDAVAWETVLTEAVASRHFLYYFRDETLEFIAKEWSFTPELVV